MAKGEMQFVENTAPTILLLLALASGCVTTSNQANLYENSTPQDRQNLKKFVCPLSNAITEAAILNDEHGEKRSRQRFALYSEMTFPVLISEMRKQPSRSPNSLLKSTFPNTGEKRSVRDLRLQFAGYIY